MELSFTEKKSIRKNFGKLKEILSIPNLIEVQKKSYKQFLESKDIKKTQNMGYQQIQALFSYLKQKNSSIRFTL